MERFCVRLMAAAMLSLFVAVAGASAQEVSHNGNTYVLYESGLSWSEAKSFCEEQGGHLVTISSRAEQKAVVNLMKSGSKKFYWIGGYKRNAKAASFSWVTGEKFSYVDWNTGSPSETSVGSKNSIMVYRSTGNWVDENGDKPRGKASNLKDYGFICEWEGPRSDDSYSGASASSGASAGSGDDSGRSSGDSPSGLGISLYAGEKIQLFAPDGTKWTSSNHDVARVSKSGLVSALSAGTSVITAKGVGRIVIRVEE